MLIIRKMEASEAKTVQKIGMRSFMSLESLFVPVAKEAMTAEIDGQIVGGMIINYIQCGDQKTAYIDAAFVHPDHHGKGIGKQLYKKTTEYLWNEGCTAITAAVKDDNAASWKALISSGFQRASLLEEVRILGLAGMLKHYFLTPFFVCNGMELYLAAKNNTVKAKTSNTGKAILQFLFMNALLLIPAMLINPAKNPLYFMSAAVLMLASLTAAGYLGSLCSKQKWEFRLNNGGAVISLGINMLGAVYPMVGNWYPLQYENNPSFRKTLAIPALMEWIFLLAIVLIALFNPNVPEFFHYLTDMAGIFLIYRLIPFYPFEGFGGRRVYQWNKLVFGVMAIISFFILIQL